MLAASLADEKALSIQYPSISPCCICKRDLPCPCVASSDRIIHPHVHPYAMRTAGRSYNCVRGSVTNTSPSVLPGPSRSSRAGPGGHPGRCTATYGVAAAGTALAVPLREQRQACPCPYVHALLSAPAAKASQPGRLLCFASAARQPCVLRPRLYTHSIQFIQTGEACRISPSGRYGSRSLSALSTAIAAAVSSTPCRPAPPGPTRRRRRPLRLGFTNGALLLSNQSVRP